MKIHFLDRIDPEHECIALLERRFNPDPNAPHSTGELRTYLSERYSIPMFELDPLLQPLQEVDEYVNSHLDVSEERLSFFFTMCSYGPVSLASHLCNVLKSGVRFKNLSEAEKLKALAIPLNQLTSISIAELEEVHDHDELFRLLLKCNSPKDVKWICAVLYYSMDECLDELDIILRKATGLFLECLPDITARCADAIDYAKERIGSHPEQLFGVLKVPALTSDVTVRPSAVGFNALHWDFRNSVIFVGIYYKLIADLVQKYSDLSATLVSRLKSISDKSRLEILKILKGGECNGQDIAERLGLAPATISHHMNLLLIEGIVTATKRGTSIYYTLNVSSLRRFIQELEHYLL